MAKKNIVDQIKPNRKRLNENIGVRVKIDYSKVKSPNSQPKAEDKSKGNNTPSDKK